MALDLKSLRYFVTVARERNVSRAADLLHMAQPPLSRQIRALEEQLGSVLFDRDTRPISLTPAGRLLYAHALQVLDRVDELRSIMNHFVASDRRRYVLGFVPSVMYAELPAIIRRFRAASPEVDLQLVEMLSCEQVTALKDGRIDIGFGRLRVEDAGIRRTVLREEPLCAVLPADHPCATEEGPVAAKAVAQNPLIVYPRKPRPSYADHVISLFRDCGFEPRIAHEVGELQTAIGLVGAGEGVCIAPASVERLGRDDVVSRPVEEPGMTSPIILGHRVHDRSPELRTLLGVVRLVYESAGFPLPPGLR
jgi:DNA-binding transcriptional LysR family regulator